MLVVPGTSVESKLFARLHDVAVGRARSAELAALTGAEGSTLSIHDPGMKEVS